MNKVDFRNIAHMIMFGKDDINYIIINEGLQYRKNKTVEHINKALQKALKNGRHKTEYEVGIFELYLTDVFKTTKVKGEVR